MVELIKEYEELSWLKKLILALICPFAWNLYRLSCSISKKNVGGIILAAVFLIPVVALPVAIFDVVFLMIKKHVWWF